MGACGDCPAAVSRAFRVSEAIGGRVLDQHALVAWARVEPYAQALVWAAMEVGMTVAIPVAALPLAYAATPAADHDVLRTLLELPVAVRDQLHEADARELGAILAGADDQPGDELVLACVVHSARKRGWPVLSGNPAALRALDPDLDIDELP